MDDIERFEKLLNSARPPHSFRDACRKLFLDETSFDARLCSEIGFCGEEIVETFNHIQNRL